MTHRGPLQPRTVCDSTVKFEKFTACTTTEILFKNRVPGLVTCDVLLKKETKKNKTSKKQTASSNHLCCKMKAFISGER